MNNEDKLKQQLNRPPVPHDLEEKIRANWQDQLSGKKEHHRWKMFAAVASVLCVMMIVFFVNPMHTTSQLVNAAITDIHSDTEKAVGITVPVRSFAKVANFKLPPNSMPVKMSKYCTLIGNKTMHIKVAGEKQGEVHLFVMPHGFNIESNQEVMGTMQTMPWKIVEPRDDLSVLVVYSHDMNPQNVEKLIQTMFYA